MNKFAALTLAAVVSATECPRGCVMGACANIHGIGGGWKLWLQDETMSDMVLYSAADMEKNDELRQEMCDHHMGEEAGAGRIKLADGFVLKGNDAGCKVTNEDGDAKAETTWRKLGVPVCEASCEFDCSKYKLIAQDAVVEDGWTLMSKGRVEQNAALKQALHDELPEWGIVRLAEAHRFSGKGYGDKVDHDTEHAFKTKRKAITPRCCEMNSFADRPAPEPQDFSKKYVIRNPQSKSVMDAGCNDNDCNVHLYEWHGRGNQQWQFTADGDIISVDSNRALDVAGGGKDNGSNLQIHNQNDTPAQKFYVRPDGTIYNPNSKKCVDVTGSGTANATNIQIHDCNGTGAQQWVLEEVK